MCNVLWAIQSNFSTESDIHLRIQSILQRQQVRCVFVEAIPFCDELPGVPADTHVVFYASTNLCNNIYKSGKWIPGVFVNENFNYKKYCEMFGDRMLNYGCTFTTVGEFAALGYHKYEELFVRPLDDSKLFSGVVTQMGGILCFPEDTKIVVSKPYKIYKEWRLFIAEGKVLSGSQYQKRHRLSKSVYVPAEVVSFAEECAKVWSPHDVFVMDVGESGGGLYIIELGSFNSSGFYLADVGEIVLGVHRYVRQHYNGLDI